MVWLLEAVARTQQPTGPPEFAVLGAIPFTNLSWEDELNRDGSLDFSCETVRLPATIRARLRDLLATPLEVRLTRGDRVMFAGPVWTRTLHQNGTLTVHCRGLGGYLRYMGLDDETGDAIFRNADQHLIARDLVDMNQQLAYGDYGLDTSGIAPSGKTRDRTYLAAEGHEVYQRLVELAEVRDGFDWHVDPATRELILEAQRGVDRSATVHFDLRNITSAEEGGSVASGDIATDVFGVAHRAEQPLTSRQSNPAIRSQFGRVWLHQGFDVETQATLEDHTARALAERGSMLRIPGPGLMPVAGADVGDFQVGDLVSYTFDAGLGVVDVVARVVKLRVQVSEQADVEMAVEFGA